ncbi:unnamed protein product [Sphagnum balticum]
MHKYLPIPPECLPFLKTRAQQIRGDIDLERIDVFGIAMVALEAMLFNSTRKYYLSNCSNELNLTFDEKQLKTDIRELRGVYPHSLVSLIEQMVEVDPERRLSL